MEEALLRHDVHVFVEWHPWGISFCIAGILVVSKKKKSSQQQSGSCVKQL
jgi:hypothetical protein